MPLTPATRDALRAIYIDMFWRICSMPPAPSSLPLYVGNLLQHLETRSVRRASPTSVQEAGEQARMLISHLIQARRVPQMWPSPGADVAESHT